MKRLIGILMTMCVAFCCFCISPLAEAPIPNEAQAISIEPRLQKETVITSRVYLTNNVTGKSVLISETTMELTYHTDYSLSVYEENITTAGDYINQQTRTRYVFTYKTW